MVVSQFLEQRDLLEDPCFLARGQVVDVRDVPGHFRAFLDVVGLVDRLVRSSAEAVAVAQEARIGTHLLRTLT
eukprot:3073299-Prorocentrum_lima.AAC.1